MCVPNIFIKQGNITMDANSNNDKLKKLVEDAIENMEKYRACLSAETAPDKETILAEKLRGKGVKKDLKSFKLAKNLREDI
jgi:hypothetical protein